MIKNTFVFLERISQKKEQQLWQRGIADWNTFLRTEKIPGISPRIKRYYDQELKAAQEALQENNSFFFIGKLPGKEMWRLYDFFREECCFLDIETDSQGKIIVAGISNYYETRHFVRGINLEKEILEKVLAQFKLLITFNGSSFDLPKLKKQLQVDIRLPHLDLKPLCVNLGLKGGLKEVEKRLHLQRPDHLQGNPVELWKAFHASGDREYLELLLAYNQEDCENLRGVMNVVWQKLQETKNQKPHSLLRGYD